VRPATVDDVDALAAVFGRAFGDYRRGLGVSAAALGRLWAPSLAARIPSTSVAVAPDGRLAGFVVMVQPGGTEQYGSPAERRRQMGLMWRELGARGAWRLPALFVPMGLAYTRRHAVGDEAYISLIAVEPELQGRGFGQALLAAAEEQARVAGARGILLHTASTNVAARAAYARAGYELVCTVRAPWAGPARIPAYVALRKALVPGATPRLDQVEQDGYGSHADRR
jgi:ribosomal-protein-alanine N-acetyltransferase